jgi:hypothetical protein
LFFFTVNTIIVSYICFVYAREVNKEKKEKRKKWKAQMREAGVNIQKAKTTKMAESSCKQRVVLDLSYDDMMSDKVLNFKFLFLLYNILLEIKYISDN